MAQKISGAMDRPPRRGIGETMALLTMIRRRNSIEMQTAFSHSRMPRSQSGLSSHFLANHPKRSAVNTLGLLIFLMFRSKTPKWKQFFLHPTVIHSAPDPSSFHLLRCPEERSEGESQNKPSLSSLNKPKWFPTHLNVSRPQSGLPLCSHLIQ